MERELVETFEAAKKAADAEEEERCVDALTTLRKLPVTLDVLVKTQVGKRLRYLTKHPHKKIQAVASDLLSFWKNVVIEETTKDDNKNNKGSSPQSSLNVKSESMEVKSEKISKSGSAKVGKSSSVKVENVVSDNGIKKETLSETRNVTNEKRESGSAKVGNVSRLGSVKVQNGIKMETGNGIKVETFCKTETIKMEKSESIKVESVHASATAAAGRVPKEPSSVPNCPPKLTSMIKSNDSTRDKIRELLADALSKVYKETSGSGRDEVKNILDEVDASDPIRVAVTVESALYEKLGSSTGAHKAKYRSIMFNLKDPKNPDFRRRVLLGEVKPGGLVDLAPEDMASDERKLANKQIKDKALFECERAGAPKATTDQFKCGRCGQRKTTYYQLQTRSADEPMTTFVTCVNCNNHWKFC
ncbi:transcription elongation factor TFIIS [Iris pallida]|uniref:Transcription elongation factor TFIIS n=1 Tax=Iris pallida TaxID=29817 RepID=A0AAX6F2L1_IRIPA|nr:transcription elongation factor TFIIS [Iris pallida]